MDNFFIKRGYSFLINPAVNVAPLQLLYETSKGVAEQINATLVDLLNSKISPVPEVYSGVPMVDSALNKSTFNFDMKAEASFLTNFFSLINKTHLKLDFEKSNVMQLEVDYPQKSYVNLIHLDRFINTSSVIGNSPFVIDKLQSDELLVITETISTKKFTLSISNSNRSKNEIESDIKIVEIDSGVKHNKNLNDSLVYQSDVPIVIAIKACKINYSKSFFKKGVFSIGEGKINVLKNEDLPLINLEPQYL